ncbi:MAG: hypothetical protein IJ705_04140, partial [Oscillospiraceae bacterium]|nr:hypothetical protein [Oscillospiraceae bacterium]
RKADGLYFEEKLIANANISVLGLCNAVENGELAAVTLAVTVAEMAPAEVTLPIRDLTYTKLHQLCPLLYSPNTPARQRINQYLTSLVVAATRKAGIPQGPYFASGGIHRIQGGAWVAAEGDELLGAAPLYYAAAPEAEELQMLSSSEEKPVTKMLSMLFYQPLALLLLFAYALTSLVRSAIFGTGVDFQAVAWLCGGQGKGKTTAAKRLAGFFVRADDPTQRPALFYDLGSTSSAVRDAMALRRDCPLILDDVCLSASRTSQEKRTELAAQIVREAANAADIVKKDRRGEEKHLSNAAGVILTAEFTLNNASDVTRCIMMKLTDQLQLPAELTPQLSGTAARAFLGKFLQSADTYLKQLKSAAADPGLYGECEPRVRSNLSVLRWAFHILLDAAADEGLSPEGLGQCVQRFDAAIRESATITSDCLATIRSNIPTGNIAYLLLKGINDDEEGFCLVRRWDKIDDKLPFYDGILPKDSRHRGFLYLRSQPLRVYICRQPGYRAYTLHKIVDELELYGALTVNEAGSKQIHPNGNHKLPRVYCISIDALKKYATQ